MAKLTKMHSIEQFRSVITHVHNTTRYGGKTELGDPIFDPSIPLPTLTFRGTVKIHGTNAGIGYDFSTGEYWTQSKESIITPEKDNAGFSTYVYKNKDFYTELCKKLQQYLTDLSFDLSTYQGIVMFGEWCGGNIQKNVAVNQLPKMFVVFGAKLISNDEEVGNYHLSDDVLIDVCVNNPDINFYNIWTFGYWDIKIDFANPLLIQNELVAITEQIEKECPVGKYFLQFNGTTQVIKQNGTIIYDTIIPEFIKTEVDTFVSTNLSNGETQTLTITTL
jgi:hypothetical protein